MSAPNPAANPGANPADSRADGRKIQMSPLGLPGQAKLSPDEEIKSLRDKLNIISAAVQLGREAFHKTGLEAFGVHIVNNSRALVPFDRSCLIDRIRPRSPKLLAVTGQSHVEPKSEYGLDIGKILLVLGDIQKTTVVTEELLREKQASDAVLAAFVNLRGDSKDHMLVLTPLARPGARNQDCRFIWCMEFFKASQPIYVGLASLLGQHYGEALWYIHDSRHRHWRQWLGHHRITPMRIFIVLMLIFAVLMFTVRINQNISAEFELAPTDKAILYAPFGGTLRESKVVSGDSVAQGTTVLRYDTDEIAFKKLESEREIEKLKVELSVLERTAFTDMEARARVPLIKAAIACKQVDVEKAAWYISKQDIRSPRNGVAVISPKEEFAGRSVQAGERLCEIIPKGEKDDGMVAEIYVIEGSASIIPHISGIHLYLHSRPEEAIPATLVDVSPRAVLNDQKQYCYRVRANLGTRTPEMIYGMKGIARVQGERMLLGYYLFRSTILWWRQKTSL